MDENKTIILGIELQTESLSQSASEAAKIIDALKQKRKELREDGKANTAEFQQNEAAIRSNTGTLKELQKQIDNTVKQRTVEKGSLNEMKANLSELTIKYNNLSKEQRENITVGGAMQKDIKKLSDELKVNESALGNNTRNVGNYKEALGALPGGLGQAAEGVSGLSKQFAKLLLNPIVLLIAAVTLAVVGLYKAFTSTDSGALEFEVRMKQVGSVLDTAKERALSFGRGIIDLFKGDSKEAAQQFGDALGVTSQSFSDAAAAARTYAEALDDIEDRETAYVARKAINANKIAKLEFSAADKANTVNQRKEALQQAVQLEREETDFAVSQANKRLNIEANSLSGKLGIRAEDLKSFVALTEEQRKRTDKFLVQKYDEHKKEIDELTKFYAKAIDADTVFFEGQKKNNAKITALNDQFIADQKKANDDAVKAKKEAEQKKFDATILRLKDEKAAIELGLLEDVKLSAASYVDQVALLRNKANTELAQKDVTVNQKLLIEKQYEQAVLKLGEDVEKEKLKVVKEGIDKQKESLTNDIETKKLILAQETLQKKAALDKQLANGEITEKFYLDDIVMQNYGTSQEIIKIKQEELTKLAALEEKGSLKQKQLLQQSAELANQYDSNITKHKIENIKKTEQIERASTNARLGMAANLFGGLASLFDQGTDEYKAFATAQVILSTIQGAMGAFAQASETYPPPYGEIIGAAFAGVVAAEGAVQISKINGLYDGGYTTTGNPREEANNVRLSSGQQLHKSEYVVPNKVLSTSLGSQLVGTLEQMRLDSPVTLGLQGYADGGFANRIAAGDAVNTQSIVNSLSGQLSKVKIVARIEDIVSAGSNKMKIESKATV